MTTIFSEILSRAAETARPPLPVRESTAMVFIVDDDAPLRGLLESIVVATGCDVESCSSAEEFLAMPLPSVPACLLLDVNLPGVSGLALQQRLAGRGEMPIIFITGCDDVPVAVQAMKAGAFDVLTKPVEPEGLLGVVASAIETSRTAIGRRSGMEALRECYESLTSREREVMAWVVTGLLNKQIAFELGISEVTVKAHRGQMMRKMRAGSLAALVGMASRLGVTRALAAR